MGFPPSARRFCLHRRLAGRKARSLRSKAESGSLRHTRFCGWLCCFLDGFRALAAPNWPPARRLVEHCLATASGKDSVGEEWTYSKLPGKAHPQSERCEDTHWPQIKFTSTSVKLFHEGYLQELL